MLVKQRAKRRPVRIWASQYSHNTGCYYFLSPRSVGSITEIHMRSAEAWSKPKCRK
jgi:hypothetical protein